VAVCAGALAVTVFGAQPSLPTRERLAKLCRERECTCL
jgi:sugar/nucleoside kinase (ribokinase family)